MERKALERRTVLKGGAAAFGLIGSGASAATIAAAKPAAGEAAPSPLPDQLLTAVERFRATIPDLDREGDLVQYVGGLVNPTPLVSGARKDLLDRLPEAERAVADREVRRNLEPTLLDVDEKLAPALCVLAYPGLEADEFLLALGCCADQHQHAFGGFFHSGLQIDPVRPHVHVSPRREVALLPGVVIRLPFCR